MRPSIHTLPPLPLLPFHLPRLTPPSLASGAAAPPLTRTRKPSRPRSPAQTRATARRPTRRRPLATPPRPTAHPPRLTTRPAATATRTRTWARARPVGEWCGWGAERSEWGSGGPIGRRRAEGAELPAPSWPRAPPRILTLIHSPTFSPPPLSTQLHDRVVRLRLGGRAPRRAVGARPRGGRAAGDVRRDPGENGVCVGRVMRCVAGGDEGAG